MRQALNRGTKSHVPRLDIERELKTVGSSEVVSYKLNSFEVDWFLRRVGIEASKSRRGNK